MNVIECIRKFCDENSEKYSIYEGYSGRGMYGRRCLGIVVSHGYSYMDMLVKLTQYLDKNECEDEELELEGVSVDELGLDIIIYFPKIES